MKAIILNEFGGADKLQLGETEPPVPQKNEVLVGVHYAGVNPVDWKIREGFLKGHLPHQLPIILGWDVSGEIVKVGDDVRNWKVGDKVYSYARKPTVQFGTYAEFVALDGENVAAVPATLSMAEAASIPLVALTAWQALFDIAKLEKGQVALIHAGAGGVGGIAIQLAKNAGATVLTTASEKNHGYVKELGAALAIDYSKENFATVVKRAYPNGVDVVFDCAGGPALNESYDLVRKGGTLVSIVETPDEKRGQELGIKVAYHFVTPSGSELKQIAGLIDSKKVQALALEVLPLAQAAEAHTKSQSRHQRGKIVLQVK